VRRRSCPVLITRHFAFLHVPKTGGSFVRRVLVDRLPPEWFHELPPARHQHQGWGELPAAADGLPVLAFVRNPWDWYVSWYHYHVQLPSNIARGAFFRTVFGNGSHSFAEAVRNACTGAFDHPDGRILHTAREQNVDFYTARVLNMLGPGFDDQRLEVGRFECLLDDLEGFLKDQRVPVPLDFHDLARSQAPVNMSRRGSYRDYYDASLSELVRARARPLIERFGYEF
jgi:hypothetical protein